MKTTDKLLDASQAFNDDFDGARWTMMRLATIQAKMSAGMDAALEEFKEIFPIQPERPEELHAGPIITPGELSDLPQVFDQMRNSGALREGPRERLSQVPMPHRWNGE